MCFTNNPGFKDERFESCEGVYVLGKIFWLNQAKNEAPSVGSGGRTRTYDTRIMIPLL